MQEIAISGFKAKCLALLEHGAHPRDRSRGTGIKDASGPCRPNSRRHR